MNQENLQKHYSSLKEDSSGITLSHLQRILDLQASIDTCGEFKDLTCPNIECREQTGEQQRLKVRRYCQIRICKHPRCRRKREDKLKAQFEAKLNSFRDPRFLTLTLKDYHSLTRVPLERLNYAWKRLSRLIRKAGYLKSYIKVIELNQHEYIDSNMEYHMVYFWHIHVVYDGIYIAADVLRAAWKQYTTDSNWIQIERVKRNFSAAAYLRKYLQKMSYDDIDIDEYYKVYKMKLVSSYNCGQEVETLLEYSILCLNIKTSKCPHCGTRMIPEREEKPPPL